MLAYLIDPALRRISDIELPDNDRAMGNEMRRLIGCTELGSGGLGERNYLWCDEWALARREPVFAFQFRNKRGKAGPFGGKAIIIGADRYGRTTPPSIPRAMLENDVDWLDVIVPELHTITEPGKVFGKHGTHIRTYVTWSRPK